MMLTDIKPLYDAGFALIYLHPRDKRPLENKWTSGPRKTWAELKRDFNPSYNVGVRLGEPSKVGDKYLMCIDVDIKDPAYKQEALNKLKEITHGVEYPTVLSGSGNGSRHLYGLSDSPFKMVEIEKHKGKWEICAYSTGRQMCLPPSIHPSGRVYQWRGEAPNRDSFPLFVPTRILDSKKGHAVSECHSKFKAVNVNLDRLDPTTLRKITDGEGVEDRSAELLSIAMKMCRAKYEDNEILSVLSDEHYWISQAAFDHTKSQDRGKATEWLRKYTLDKARHETHPLRLFEGKPDYTLLKHSPSKLKETQDAITAESKTVLPDLDGNMKPKNTLRNVVRVLEDFMGGRLVGFNEFSCRPYFLKDTVYGGIKGKELASTDDLALKHYLAENYRFEPSKETCYEAHTILAQKYKFHPVKAYLESLEWDGVPRLDDWLVNAFEATGPTEYVQAVSRKILCAAVARIYDPGCKFDYMTVLEGNQGEGKSMSLGMLVGAQWFTDSLGDIHNKDVVDQMIGKWLIEVSELDSVRGREKEAVKAFVSRQVDRVRLSYERRAQDYPRQCIFIGSTNDQEYLNDETGNRRYWPIKVGRARRKWLERHRDQLWSEAKYRYELGEKLYLSKEVEDIAKGEQEKRFEVDEWEALIRKIVETQEGPFITTELFKAIHDGMPAGHPDMLASKRIGKVMRRLGYHRTEVTLENKPRCKGWVER